MRKRVTICVLVVVIIIFSLFPLYGSERGIWPSHPHRGKVHQMMKPPAPPAIVVNWIAFFYHRFISPNDYSHCPFNPTCSHFMFQSIKEFGIVGIIMGTDRLMRDNFWSREGKYPEINGRLIDPPRWHYLPYYWRLDLEKIDFLLFYK